MDERRERKRKWDVAEPTGQQAPPPPPPDQMDPKQLALAAASRLNAMLMAKGVAKPGSAGPEKQESGACVREVEINHCIAPVRYLLTKGTTHHDLLQQTGATVIARGRFKTPEDTSSERGLYLHISADTQQQADECVARIEQLMKKGATEVGGKSMLTCKVPLGVDANGPFFDSFNFVGKIIGPKGAHVKHIETASHAKVQLKGRRVDPRDPRPDPKAEPQEEMHLAISAFSEQSLEQAKSLAEDLLKHVKDEYQEFVKNRTAQAAAGPYGRGAPPPPVYSPYGPLGPYPPPPMAGRGGPPGMPYYPPPPYGYGFPPGGPYPPVYSPYPAEYPYGQPPGQYPSPYPQAPAPYPASSPDQQAAPVAQAYPGYPQYPYGQVLPPGSQPSTDAAPQTGGEENGSREEEEGESSPRPARRFQEFPSAPSAPKRQRTDGEEGPNEEASLGPQRPTLEEYRASSLPEPESYGHRDSTPSTKPPGAKEPMRPQVDVSPPQAAVPSQNEQQQQNTAARPFWATPGYSDSIFAQNQNAAPDSAQLDQEYNSFYEAMGLKK